MTDIQKIRELKEVRDKAWAAYKETEAAALAAEEVYQRECEESKRKMSATKKVYHKAWDVYRNANTTLENAKNAYWDDL